MEQQEVRSWAGGRGFVFGGSLGHPNLRMTRPCLFVKPSRRGPSARGAPPLSDTETKQQREERLEKGRAERRQLRQRLVEDDDAVLTFKEWCALNGVSERQGRRILTSGNGPTVTMLTDKRVGISRRANRAWQQARARA